MIRHQNRIYTDKFWCSFVSDVFNALNVQLISLSFMYSKVSFNNLWRNNVFHNPSKNYFPAVRSFLLAWLSDMKLLKVNPALFVSVVPKQPQAAMQSS